MSEMQLLLFTFLSRKEFSEYVVSGAQGSANQASVTLQHLFSHKLCFPSGELSLTFGSPFTNLYTHINKLEEETVSLKYMETLLLAQMTKVETEKEIINEL